MAEITLEQIHKTVPFLTQFPAGQSWIDYDKEADVLYINFEKPEAAHDSEMTDDDIIVRKKGGKIVGFTVLNASSKD